MKILFFCSWVILFTSTILFAEEGEIATATSESQNFEAGNAFDGNPRTSWKAATGQGPVSLVYQFPTERSLSHIRTTFPAGRAFLYRIDVIPAQVGNGSAAAAAWVNVAQEKVGKGTMEDRFPFVKVREVKTTIRNFLKHSSFEQLRNNPYGEAQEDWVLGSGELTSEAHTGKYAVKDNSGYVTMVYSIELSDVGAKSYTLSFYGMSPDKEIGYWVIFGEKEDGTRFEIEKNLRIFPSKYTFLRSSVFFPKDAAVVTRFNLYRFTQKGTIYYDDVFLIPGWTPSDIPEILEQTFE